MHQLRRNRSFSPNCKEFKNYTPNEIGKTTETFEETHEKFKACLNLISRVSLTQAAGDGRIESQIKNTKRFHPCVFYDSIWFPRVNKVSSLINFSDLKIRINKQEMSFEEGTLKCLQTYYNNGKGVFRVPAVIFQENELHVKQATEKLTDLALRTDNDVQDRERDPTMKHLTNHQRDEVLRKRNAKRSVEVVAHTLEMFGRRNNMDMFVFTDYKYAKYLQHVKLNQKEFVTDVKGDHDVLVICREFGILFIQVKSTAGDKAMKTIKKDMGLALEQLLSDKYAFWQSNRDLAFIQKLPIHSFIAFPFLDETSVEHYSICAYHKKFILFKSTFASAEKFLDWFKENIRELNTITDTEYQTLTARYVGKASIASLPDPIKATAHQLGCHKAEIFLNPDQLAIAETDKVEKLHVIAGNYGTGKTLLLILLAKKIANKFKQSKVYFITCTDINKEGLCRISTPFQAASHVDEHLKTNKSKLFGEVYREVNETFDSRKHNILFITPTTFFDTLTTLKSRSRDCHFVLDEVPFFLLDKSRTDFQTSFQRFRDFLGTDSFVWISVASHTYKVDVSLDENPVKIKSSLDSSFQFHYLKYTMRICGKLFRMVQGVEAYTKDGHHRFSECGHVIEGPMPRLYILRLCKCDDVADVMRTLPCNCSEERLSNVLNKVFRFLENNYQSDITIIIENGIEGPFYHKLCTLVHNSLQGHKTKWLLAFKAGTDDDIGQNLDEKNKIDVITVADGRTFRGCESRIVIIIDPFGMNQWFQTKGHVGMPTVVFTRCLSQYIHVTWPQEESCMMAERVLKEYKCLIQSRSYFPQEWVANTSEYVRQATDSPRYCLQTLLRDELIMLCKD